MEFFEADSFFRTTTRNMFYVGIMKTPEAWFPFCLVSDPQQKNTLDTLPLSLSHQSIVRLVDEYARHIPQVEQTFVQYMTSQEILDLIKSYGLEKIVLIHAGEDQTGCGCGCGC